MLVNCLKLTKDGYTRTTANKEEADMFIMKGEYSSIFEDMKEYNPRSDCKFSAWMCGMNRTKWYVHNPNGKWSISYEK